MEHGQDDSRESELHCGLMSDMKYSTLKGAGGSWTGL